MTITALQRKVETLEKAFLQMRFQLERHALTGAAHDNAAPVTLTPKQFGDRIGRTADWVRHEITMGRIKAYGPPWLIPGSELARFI